jgi:propionate CoA-transferase
LQLLNPDEAAALIESGDTVTVSGVVMNMVPEEVLKALELRFLATGEPSQLTEIHPWLYGSEDGTGMNRWAHDGFLKRTIGSTYILPASSKTS